MKKIIFLLLFLGFQASLMGYYDDAGYKNLKTAGKQ